MGRIKIYKKILENNLRHLRLYRGGPEMTKGMPVVRKFGIILNPVRKAVS